MKTLSSILLAGLLLACNDPPQGPSPVPDFRVSPAQQWSGGEVTVVSSYFVDLNQIPSFKIDSFSVPAARVDDSTVILRLPALPSGAFDLFVDAPRLFVPVGNVQVFGYGSNQALPVALVDYLSTTTLSQGLVALGTVWTSGRGWVAAASLSSGTVTTFVGLSSIGSTVGPSFRGPDVALLIDSAGTMGEWRLSPVPTLIDTVGARYLNAGANVVAAFADSSYIALHGNAGTTKAGPWLIASPERVYLSPRGDRATVSASVTRPGIPVFDMQTGDTAYTLPVQIVTAATFSRDGSKLYVGGGDPSNITYVRNQLYALDATTGVVLAHDSLPPLTRQAASLALDFSEHLLFVASESAGVPQVLVYDASTLALLGTLAANGSLAWDCQYWCDTGTLAVDDSRRTIYYVVSKDNAVILRFDMMP